MKFTKLFMLGLIIFTLSACGGGGGGGSSPEVTSGEDWTPLTISHMQSITASEGVIFSHGNIVFDRSYTSTINTIGRVIIGRLDGGFFNEDIGFSYELYNMSDIPTTAHSVLYIDSDYDTTTGYAVRGIGADIKLIGTDGAITDGGVWYWQSASNEWATANGDGSVTDAEAFTNGYYLHTGIYNTDNVLNASAAKGVVAIETVTSADVALISRYAVSPVFSIPVIPSSASSFNNDDEEEIDLSTLFDIIGSRVAVYPLNGTGTEYDNDSSASVFGGSACADKENQTGQAYCFFDNDYMVLPSPIEIFGASPDGWSASAWFKTNDSSSAQAIISDYYSNGWDGFYGLSVLINEDGTLQYSIRKTDLADPAQVNGHVTYAVESANTVSAGTWYHVVVTASKDTGELSMYLNGDIVGAVPFDTAFDYFESDPMRIASSVYLGNTHVPFNGAIDNLKLYDSALTGVQVQDLYNSER